MGAAAICLEMVTRGRPIREANQDSEAARRVRIGLSRSESIELPTRGFSVFSYVRLLSSRLIQTGYPTGKRNKPSVACHELG